jgi:hypothetical protein
MAEPRVRVQRNVRRSFADDLDARHEMHAAPSATRDDG